MTHSSTFRSVIVAVAAIIFLFISSVELRAQNTYKRGAILEEFTGTWCPHCPPGAWALDSMQQKYGDNLVEITWHGGQTVPGPGQDPLWLKTHDSLFLWFGCTGWPTGEFNRAVHTGFGFPNPPGPDVPVYILDFNNPTLIPSFLNTSPSIDFRIVNAIYDPAARTVNFDLDITPFDMTKMRSDDTTTYATVAVLTEDNVLETQANSGDWDQVPAGDLSDFHEMNVVRKVGGGAKIGNTFTMGTKIPTQTLPIRTHYSMDVDASWSDANIKIKTFPQAIFPKTGKTVSVDVMDAKQSVYVTSLPQTAADMVWVVLPNSKSTIKTSAPIGIVWAGGGNVTTGKLEYTIDGGSTWNPIIASTTQSPYSWPIPKSAYSKTAQIRVSDANNKGTNALSESFQIPAAPIPGTMTVTKPAKDEVVQGGLTYAIQITESHLVAPIKFEYSLDGNTWNTIGSLNVEGNTMNWNVPNTASTNATVRVTDANGVIASSGIFSITQSAGLGTITSVNVNNLDSKSHIDNGVATTITWTTTAGNLGSSLIVEYSMTGTWTAIGQPVATTVTSIPWTTPAGYSPSTFVRVRSADPDKQTISAQFGPFTVGSSTGVYTNAINGYSISNCPNPFGGTTTIKFELPVRSFVTIRIQDELGREIDKLVTETFDAGSHSVTYNAANISNGVYTYTLEAGSTKLVGKMSVVK